MGDFLEGSGLTNYLLNTYSYINDENIEIEYMSYSNSSSLDEYFSNQNKLLFKVSAITANPIKHVRDWVSFFKSKKDVYDVVHFNYSASWNFIAVVCCKKMTDAKIIIHSHNNYYSKVPSNTFIKTMLGILNGFGRNIFNKYAAVKLAASKEAGEWMFNSNKDVIIEKNGIDVEKYKFNIDFRIKHRNTLNISKDTLLLGFIGRLEQRKNPKFCIDILENIIKDNSNTHLIIIGEGSMKSELINYIKEKKLENHCSFLGNLNNVNEWYSALDIFLFPSISEGFGFVLLEAQANGLLSLSSDIIPKDAKVTSSVKSFSIDRYDFWINEIINFSINLNNRKTISNENKYKIIENGFSIVSSSLDLKRTILDMKAGG